jgi:magnesium chelatase family protein
MVAYVSTVAFQGIEVVDVEVQVQTSAGLPSFNVVGLPDKAVGESRERVRAALHAMGLALPNKRITVNLSPADLSKEGSHYDLPIALGLLVAMGVLESDDLAGFAAIGELTLDGKLLPVSGVLPAAVHASGISKALICPASQANEAAWAGQMEGLAAPNLLSLINHFKGSQRLEPLKPIETDKINDMNAISHPDLNDIKGQETAKRALEIAAAGGHNLLMVGPPGSGKSMLAARLPGLLPPLDVSEILESSMIQSLSGLLKNGHLAVQRPFRDPHHSASVAALVGGGNKARPGEISLAHLGVLFLDELPEFNRAALEALRQPLETGTVTIARANAHVSYPARVQLIAAMNPCRCGHLADALRACSRAPRCSESYQNRISGPLLDRFDLHIDVPAVRAADLALPPPAEGTKEVALRIARARRLQRQRFKKLGDGGTLRTNSDADGKWLERIATPDDLGKRLLVEAAERFGLSARAYHRVLRVGRTIADLDQSEELQRCHIAEALSYRRLQTTRGPAPVQFRAAG